MFPVTPGSANLALASPLFPSVTITLPDGRRLVEQAPGAAASRPFVHALTVSGVAQPAPAGPACARTPPRPRSPTGTWNLPWLPASVIRTGGTLRYTLSSSPDPTWASSPAAALRRSPRVSSRPSGSRCRAARRPLPPGKPRRSRSALRRRGPGDDGPLAGHVDSERAGGLAILGNADARAGDGGPGATAACGQPLRFTQALTVTGASAGSYSLHVALTTTDGVALPPVVLDVLAR